MTCSLPPFAPRWLSVLGVALALASPSLPASAASTSSSAAIDADATGGNNKGKGKKKKGKKKKGSGVDAATASNDGAAKTDTAAQADNAAQAEVPEAPGEPTFSVVTPIKVRGKLSKSARGNLVFSLKTAAAGAKAEGGPYRLALRVDASKKKVFKLTLTVLAADGTTVASHQDGCKGCTLVEAAGLIPGIVETASSKIVPPPPPAAAPGSLTVASVPLGATVSVDGTDHGLTPQTLELPPGEHTIVVTKPGFSEYRETVTLEDGGELKVEPTLAAVAAATTTKGNKGKTKPPKGPKSTKGRPWIISGGVVMGLGLAGVATGVAMLLIDEQPHGFKCSDADLDFRGVCRNRYDTLTGGIVGTAVGALGIGGGIALMVQGRRVNVKARASATQASVDLVLRF